MPEVGPVTMYALRSCATPFAILISDDWSVGLISVTDFALAPGLALGGRALRRGSEPFRYTVHTSAAATRRCTSDRCPARPIQRREPGGGTSRWRIAPP